MFTVVAIGESFSDAVHMQSYETLGREYDLHDIAALRSPRLLVYRHLVEENVERMRSFLEDVAPGSGMRHLCAHVKTHKSAAIHDLLVRGGVRSFKCSLNELEMLLTANAEDVFLAYPLLPHDARKVLQRLQETPGTRLTLQVGSLEHAELLASAAKVEGVEVDVLLDVDIGTRRTGCEVGGVTKLARDIQSRATLGPLRLRGLHAYDGHNHGKLPAERESCAREAMGNVVECVRELKAAGLGVERVVVGGSPGFLPDLRELTQRHRLDAEVLVSPGTWVYWDTNYDALLPGAFRIAALLLGQVMDRPRDDLITLNLGHKRWAIDSGPLERFSLPNLEFVSVTEEHTVLRSPEPRPEIGTPLLLAPRHVCPTVNLWEHFTLVGPDGKVEEEAVPVTARNR